MPLIQRIPEDLVLDAQAIDEVIRGLAELTLQIADHFLERRCFMDKLGTLREQDTVQETCEPCGALLACAPEIGGIKRGRVRNQSEMFGMAMEAAQDMVERPRKANTKTTCDIGRLI